MSLISDDCLLEEMNGKDSIILLFPSPSPSISKTLPEKAVGKMVFLGFRWLPTTYRCRSDAKHPRVESRWTRRGKTRTISVTSLSSQMCPGAFTPPSAWKIWHLDNSTCIHTVGKAGIIEQHAADGIMAKIVTVVVDVSYGLRWLRHPSLLVHFNPVFLCKEQLSSVCVLCISTCTINMGSTLPYHAICCQVRFELIRYNPLLYFRVKWTKKMTLTC